MRPKRSVPYSLSFLHPPPENTSLRLVIHAVVGTRRFGTSQANLEIFKVKQLKILFYNSITR